MLLQSEALVANKWLVGDKITNKYVSWVLYIRLRTLSGEKFCFLEKQLLSIIKFCASSNLLFCFFYELLISPQPPFLEYIHVIFL